MTTYHRNQRQSRAADILDYVRQHPGATIFQTADALNTNWRTVRYHLQNFELSKHVTSVRVIRHKAREYQFTATETGMTADLSQIAKHTKNCPATKGVTKETKQRPAWVNPYAKYKTIAERIAAIAADAMRDALAPEQ